MPKKIIALTVLVLGLVGYYVWAKAPIEDTSISLKWLHQAQFAGLYVAEEEGFYEENGLNVRIDEFDFAKDPASLLTDGEVDFALMGSEEFLSHVDDGDDIIAVAAFYQVSPYALVSFAESGIETPADFVGKTLGSKGGTVGEELIYRLLMEDFGILLDDVEFKVLGFDKREIDDLLDGDADIVDLYRTDQLYFFDQEGLDYNIIYPERFGVNINNDLLVTRKSLAAEKPDLVKRFIAASTEGWEFALDNPDSAVRTTLQYVTNENYKDADYERYILDNSVSLVKPGFSSQIGEIRGEQMSGLYEVMVENQFIENEFQVSDFYTREYLSY
jgi:ABC-type nitrate/sulfonate/bicarbonate transport system substrate-binding protein